MFRMAKIGVDKLANEINDILSEYKGLLESDLEEAVDEVSKSAVNELKNTSPEGDTGEYKRSWKRKKTRAINGAYHVTIYAGAPHYRLAHLLEFGHALKSGGRTVGRARAFPHIKKVETNAIAKLETKIKQAIEEVNK